MTKVEVLLVKDAVHKIQLSLLEGIRDENQLSAAGSLLSQSDYHDVVTERTIASTCGYPLCSNSLPERPRKGRYRISLKEHKVYDLQETYMYCSSSCLINSQAYAASLQDERSSILNSEKLSEVLKLLEGKELDSSVNMDEIGDLGLSRLTIREKTDNVAGEVSLEEWVGPSNSIDGYVPRDRNTDTRQSKDYKKSGTQRKVESKHRRPQPDMNFTSLNEAAEVVASGKSDASDAVGEGKSVDTDPVQLKWPPKPGFSTSDLFDSEDSLYDNPPEGFNLTLSPFSTMYTALFSWVSSSSLSYVYGKEESFLDEYLSVNGREYPCKICMPDGRSSEIKQTLSGCLSRVLPGLLTELMVPVPLSVIEKGMGYLLDTMSFVDPLPAFRMNQWQVILLLFLDALSVSRIPALTPYVLDRRILLLKVFEGAQISAEEFEIMKDLIIPLGRVPQFSTQSGG